MKEIEAAKHCKEQAYPAKIPKGKRSPFQKKEKTQSPIRGSKDRKRGERANQDEKRAFKHRDALRSKRKTWAKAGESFKERENTARDSSAEHVVEGSGYLAYEQEGTRKNWCPTAC